MVDRFQKDRVLLDDPAIGAVALNVVSQANAALDTIPRKVYVGQGGNLAVRMLGYNSSNSANLAQFDKTGNNDVLFVNIANGTVLDVRVSHIFTTTTANSIVLLF